MKEKLAAALLVLWEARGGEYDREAFKRMPADRAANLIIAAFDIDHYPVPVALGGTNHPTNLVPRLRAEHRLKTAKTDIPAIAKVARLSKEHEAFRARMLAMREDAPSRPKANIKSGGFDKRYTKKMDGTVKKRESC